MNLQTRIEVQMAIQQWIVSFMNQYDLPAYLIEDALNKVLVQLKEQTANDLMMIIADQAQHLQEHEMQEHPAHEYSPQEQETLPSEQEE